MIDNEEKKLEDAEADHPKLGTNVGFRLKPPGVEGEVADSIHAGGGSAVDLQDYQGGRDFDSLKKFADENFKPMCSPTNIDLCDDGKKKEIKKFQDLSEDDLQKLTDNEEKKLEDAEANFKAEVEKLQATYEKLMADKQATEDEIKNSGLGLMKSVRAAAKAKDSKDEL